MTKISFLQQFAKGKDLLVRMETFSRFLESILKEIEDIKSRAEKPLLLFTILEKEAVYIQLNY